MIDLNELHVSRETKDRLVHFVSLFEKWSKAINLAAPSTLPDMWTRHILDSVQIFQLSPKPKHWIDLGSGGGFPGVITAILLQESGEGWVNLIESNNKKAAFLRTAILETGARGEVHAVRIEKASGFIDHCDAISARALAELPVLLDYVEPWMSVNKKTVAYFHKGRDYEREIEKAFGAWQFDLVKHESVVDPISVILEIKNLSRRPL